MLYSGAATSLQGLVEHNDEGDDDDDCGGNDDDSDNNVLLAWWKQPLKELSLTSISPCIKYHHLFIIRPV